jgi:hypothetical protein
MDDKERARRFVEKLAEELKAGDLGLWWLSFADGTKPKGAQFLGVVILEAYGFTDAIDRSHAMGLNPGGEVMGDRVDPAKHPAHLRNRLLQRDELVDIGVSTLDSKDKIASVCVCGNCNKGPQ